MDTKLHENGFPLEVAEPIAEWHLPEDEAERVRYSPWSNVWLRLVAWVFLVAGFFAFASVSRFIANNVSQFIAISEALILILLSQSVLVYLYRKISNHVDIGTGFRRLRSKVPEEVTLPIRVEIRRLGVITGRDEGYMWHTDGTWYFKGLQTAFRFNQEDVVPVEAWPRRITPDPSKDKPPRVLPMKSKMGPLQLAVEVIDPHEDFAKRKKTKAFYRELYNWLYERPRGSIESLMPPISVHPSLLRTGKLRYEGAVSGLVMVGLNAAVLLRLPGEVSLATDAGSFGLLVTITVGVLLFAGFRLAWLELRDLAVRAKLQDQNDS